jgi:hypothetical protein
MALRYWVGGTNTWNNIVGTKWALTSGGAGGLAVPAIGDDVFFDAKSAPNWIALTVTTLTTIRCPLAGTGNGYYYECTTAGTTGATEPTWPIIPGNTVVDGTVTWTCRLAVVTLGTTGFSLALNFTGYIGTFTFSSNLQVAGTMTLGTGTTYLTSGTVTSFTIQASTGMTLVSNGKILPVNFTTNGNTTINGNADFQGNFASSATPHSIQSSVGVPCDLRIGGNISFTAINNSLTNTVTFKAYGLNKTFAANGASNNQIIVFVSGSVYTNTIVNVGISGTSSYTVDVGGRFNAFNNIASSTVSGTLTLSGFNGLSDFMSITSNGTYVLSNDTIIKGFLNISAICTISTSTGAKLLLEGNLTSSTNAAVTIDNLEFSGILLSTVSASTSGGNLQIKNLSFNKTGAGSVNFTSLFGLAIPAAATYTWTHTAGTITQSSNSRINIAATNITTSQLTYSESGSLTTPFTFSQLSINGGVLSLNSKLRATRLYLTLGLSLTNITSSGLIGFDVDMLYFINSASALKTIRLKSGCTYNISVDFISYVQFATLGQITLNASTVGGTRAYFNLDNNAAQSVEYVSATDIDSSGTLGVPQFTKQLIWSFNGVIAGTTINWSTGSQPPPVLPSRTVAYTFVN